MDTDSIIIAQKRNKRQLPCCKRENKLCENNLVSCRKAVSFPSQENFKTQCSEQLDLTLKLLYFQQMIDFKTFLPNNFFHYSSLLVIQVLIYFKVSSLSLQSTLSCSHKSHFIVSLRLQCYSLTFHSECLSGY